MSLLSTAISVLTPLDRPIPGTAVSRPVLEMGCARRTPRAPHRLASRWNRFMSPPPFRPSVRLAPAGQRAHPRRRFAPVRHSGRTAGRERSPRLPGTDPNDPDGSTRVGHGSHLRYAIKALPADGIRLAGPSFYGVDGRVRVTAGGHGPIWEHLNRQVKAHGLVKQGHHALPASAWAADVSRGDPRTGKRSGERLDRVPWLDAMHRQHSGVRRSIRLATSRCAHRTTRQDRPTGTEAPRRHRGARRRGCPAPQAPA